MFELKLKGGLNQEVEIGDIVFLKDANANTQGKTYLVHKHTKRDYTTTLILVNLASGSAWDSNGHTEEEIRSLITRYNGRLIKKDDYKITVEEI